MAADGTIRSRIRSLLRSPSIKLRRSGTGARHRRELSDKVRATDTHTEPIAFLLESGGFIV